MSSHNPNTIGKVVSANNIEIFAPIPPPRSPANSLGIDRKVTSNRGR